MSAIPYYRVDGDQILERREMESIPEHKAYLWRPEVIEGSGPVETKIVEADRVRVVKSEVPLDQLKADFRRHVDDDAERVRLKYITPGAGMAITYQEKKDQAVAVIKLGQAAANALADHGADEFPTLSASVPIETSTLFAAAELVLARYENWVAVSRLIEKARLEGKRAIANATTVEGVRAAYEAITWPTP